jgi:hypothetical protein
MGGAATEAHATTAKVSSAAAAQMDATATTAAEVTTATTAEVTTTTAAAEMGATAATSAPMCAAATAATAAPRVSSRRQTNGKSDGGRARRNFPHDMTSSSGAIGGNARSPGPFRQTPNRDAAMHSLP